MLYSPSSFLWVLNTDRTSHLWGLWLWYTNNYSNDWLMCSYVYNRVGIRRTLIFIFYGSRMLNRNNISFFPIYFIKICWLNTCDILPKPLHLRMYVCKCTARKYRCVMEVCEDLCGRDGVFGRSWNVIQFIIKQLMNLN